MILEQEIEKIRAVRHKISADCGHDLKRLFQHYQQLEKELRASGQVRFADPAKSASITKPAA